MRRPALYARIVWARSPRLSTYQKLHWAIVYARASFARAHVCRAIEYYGLDYNVRWVVAQLPDQNRHRHATIRAIRNGVEVGTLHASPNSDNSTVFGTGSRRNFWTRRSYERVAR